MTEPVQRVGDLLAYTTVNDAVNAQLQSWEEENNLRQGIRVRDTRTNKTIKKNKAKASHTHLSANSCVLDNEKKKRLKVESWRLKATRRLCRHVSLRLFILFHYIFPAILRAKQTASQPTNQPAHSSNKTRSLPWWTSHTHKTARTLPTNIISVIITHLIQLRTRKQHHYEVNV